jgi:hypothetical protein
MRAREFVIEYNTQATVNAMGSKIIDALKLPSVLGSLKQGVHNAHNMDSMKSEPYYIFYRGNDFGAQTHYTFNFPTKFFNAINMHFAKTGLMEYQSLAGLKLVQYVYDFAVKKMQQDPRDSSWQNTVEQAWKEGTQKLQTEIVSDIIKIIESFDPTKNKQYTLQLVKWFINGRNFPKIEDGESTLRQALYDFQKLKARIPEEYRDIRRYSNPKEFVDNVQTLKYQYGKEDAMSKGKSEIIYDKDGVTARWAMDEEAACYLGQGTQWCTAATQSTNYFDNYNKTGGLVVVNLAKPIEFYVQNPDGDSANPENMDWPEIRSAISDQYGDGPLDDLLSGYHKWIRETKLEDYDEELIQDRIADRKDDDNEVEEFIDSYGGPTEGAIERFKDDFKRNDPEEYENRIEDGSYSYMDWVREWIEEEGDDAFESWLEDDIRRNKEVEAEAFAIALEDLGEDYVRDWAEEAYGSISTLLTEYGLDIDDESRNEHIKKTSKLQMHVVPESESVRSRVEKGTSYDNAWDFKITTMTDEQDDEIPEDVLYAPDFGDTALSQAFTEGGLKKALSDVALQYNRGM